jgi:hypothetical protein
VRPPSDELRRPHYFRLGYQLAAQEANWLFDRKKGSQSSEGERDESPDRRPSAKVALEHASRTSAHAAHMLRWYESRQVAYRRWKLWGPKKLTQHELGMVKFLAETVEPCAELITAGLMHFLKRFEEAELHASPIRDRSGPDAQGPPLSYRALYNLACYEVTRGTAEHLPKPDDEALALALRHLRDAFRLANYRLRRELLTWARRDPTLKPLRTSKDHGPAFEKLLKRFDLPGAEPTKARGLEH